MTKFLTKAVLGASLAATALVAAAPAEAQRYRRHHDDGTGTAIVAGIAGLAIGAAIASSNRRDRYDNRRYDDRSYNYQYRQRNNGYNYYNRQNGYNDYRQCRIERRYDPYYGRNVRVRVCY